MVIRDYLPEDAQALMELFHSTVHGVCAADYTPEQLAAWSPESGLRLEKWKLRFASTKPFVATTDGAVVGFIEFEADGHIDCLYVHRDMQGRGVGTSLLQHALDVAKTRSIERIYAEVSLTARLFFERHGFSVVRAQEVEKDGQRLKNFVMERLLDAG